MARDINLTSQEWCDFVFEGKNKNYGAYKMRSESSKRHLLAIIIVAAAFMAVLALPKIFNSNIVGNKTISGLSGTIQLTDPIEEEKKPEIVIPQNKPLPQLSPKEQKAIKSIVYTAPIMVSAEQMGDNDLLSVDKILESEGVVANITVDDGEILRGAITTPINVNSHITEEINKPLDFSEQSPMFPGGEDEMMRFIQKNLRYPQISLTNGMEGRVVLRFVVNKNGEVSNIEVLRSVDAACDKEAIRVLKLMPKWQAGRHNGIPVDVYYTLPIVYKIQK